MSEGYTADELFEIAEDIEQEGEAFYKKAARHTKKEKTRKMFLELAREERAHREAIRGLRRQFAGVDRDNLLSKPDKTVSLFLRLVAKGSVFPTSLRGKAAMPESEEDAVKMAIGKELEAVLYYCGMKDLVADDAAREALEAIVRDEQEHVVTLATHRKRAT